MSDEAEGETAALLRASLFGAFVIERRVDGQWVAIERQQWGKGNYTRMLCKRLLCATGRRLSRGKLLEDLWPDAADRNLDDSAYKLRRLLREASGQSLLQTSNGGYQLANQSLIWTDADACATLLQEAEQKGRITPAALPLLEQALHYFERGTFLEDEEGTWCHSLRKARVDMMHCCRIWLAEAYETQGKPWQAQTLYRKLLDHDPGNEEALRRLMLLLAGQGMTRQALRCYEDYKGQLELEAFQLSLAMQELVKQLQNGALPVRVQVSSPVQNSDNQEILDKHSTINDADILQLSILTQSYLPLDFRLQDVDKEILGYIRKLSETCWYLSKNNQLHMAEVVLWTYLPRIITLAQRHSEYQETIASYVSQGYLLAASLAGHRNDLQKRYYFSEQALLYGKLAEDHNLSVSALKQLAQTLDYLETPTQTIQTYQKALPYIRNVSPLLRSRMYAGLAGTYAQSGQEQEALRYLGLAYESFPERPEDDPSFLYVDADYFVLLLWDGLTHLDLNKPKEAYQIFNSIEILQSQRQKPLEKVRVEFLNYRAIAMVDLGELEQGSIHLEQAVKSAQALGSERLFQETFQTFRRIQTRWPEESRIKELADLFCETMRLQ